MANVEKASGIYPPDLTESEQGDEIQKKLLQKKGMSVSFMKMNNSRKRRGNAENLENFIQKHLQKQVKELLKQIMKRIQKRKKEQDRVEVRQ